MTRLTFGTDGVRARANSELTVEFAVALGRAAVQVLDIDQLVIGRDTRHSGTMLEAAVAAGAASAGSDALLLGVVPTPAVAVVADELNAGGAMISASHNPFGDNGIKLFGPGGRKLTDDQQSAVVAALDATGTETPTGEEVGTVESRTDLISHYLTRMSGALAPGALASMRVVVDCAHGSQSFIAEGVLRSFGAEVEVIGASPDGTNINEGFGSTAPEVLAERVVASGADLGLAFDGDADRLVAVSGDGRVVDGDRIIALLALDLKSAGRLTDDTVVVTVMTNQGFRLAMKERGITVVDTPVGDRHVLEALERGGWSVGGEQSGHVIVPSLGPTGDGLLTGLLLCDLVARSGQPLEVSAAEAMDRLPQVLHNVRIESDAAEIVSRLADDIATVEATLGPGRVLVRPSGTEPLVRVMVEAETNELAESAALQLVASIEAMA